MVRALAPFLSSPIAGVVADRYNRKYILILTDITRALTVVGFFFIREPGHVWILYLLTAVQLGIPVPALSSALAYYDGYRCERLPANLLQAQRDYFGAHTYQRTDRPSGRHWHTRWTDDRGEEPVDG